MVCVDCITTHRKPVLLVDVSLASAMLSNCGNVLRANITKGVVNKHLAKTRT